MQEQERPGLTKCDRMSQISIVKDASRAHPVYIMNEQPAQSIPSDNYVEKSLILTAYWYDRNFYCLVIDAMLNRTPLSQDLHIRVNVAPNRILVLLKFSRSVKIPFSMSRPMSGYDGMNQRNKAVLEIAIGGKILFH